LKSDHKFLNYFILDHNLIILEDGRNLNGGVILKYNYGGKSGFKEG
jgi:hypothetical protein